MKPRIVIIGAGGHGKVLCEGIIAEGKYELIGFVDHSIAVGTKVIFDYKVILSESEMDKLSTLADFFIIGIGNNKTRAKLFRELSKILKPATIIHPSAIISKSAVLNNGSVCLANTVMNANSIVGENTIVNSGVIIDHECTIGSHVHLSIGTMVGSNSVVEDFSTTPIGANINPFSKLLN